MNFANRFSTEAEAVNRLISVANGNTPQSRKVANFLLAWWNARTCGGFDLTDLWTVQIANDMLTVIGFLREFQSYPDVLGYRADFEQLVRDWRPELIREPTRATRRGASCRAIVPEFGCRRS